MVSTILKDKQIVLGVCGGIAAYKSVELLRLLRRQEAHVRVVMTRNATYFVGPVTFEALAGQRVCTNLFEGRDDASIRHIEWAQQADGVVIAPATANMLGKLAHGIADDALSTFMMAVAAPVLLCPAMNTQMYASPSNQRNLARLQADGCTVLEPDEGELACGTTGPGRLPDPLVILDRFQRLLSPKDLIGRKIVVTAGPTWEAIDPVRFISNPSSGKMGYALAKAAEHRGAEVVLISGPVGLAGPLGVQTLRVLSAAEMAAAVYNHMTDAQVIIKSAAVSDYRVQEPAQQKVKKDKQAWQLDLVRNPDILKELGCRKNGQILVGFAAETEALEQHATHKLTDKNLDMIVGNLIGRPGAGFRADTNQVVLVDRSGRRESLPIMPKEALAHLILDRIVQLLHG